METPVPPSARKISKRELKSSKLLREVLESSDDEPVSEEHGEPQRSSKKHNLPEGGSRLRKRAKVAAKKFDEQDDQSESSEESDGSEKGKHSSVKRKRQHNRTADNETDNTSLPDIIKYKGKLVPRAAKRWVERYETNEKAALAELLMSLFEVCGVKYHLDEDSVDETGVDDVVINLVSQARDGDLEDYLGSKQRELRGFKENLLYFWDCLIRECQNGPLFDQKLVDKCIDFVIALSCTPPRVFRQVTTLVGLQLVSSLVSIAKILGESRETAQRQLNAEKKKHKDGPRVESLVKSLSLTHAKITKVEEMMRRIFTSLFVHRYRDVDPDIRMASIHALGSWIASYPSLFLQDLYLKYIGWTLNDKNAGVRKSSIDALQALYKIEDNVPSLGLFTERFCNRMVELADDVDVHVAVSAIGLLKELLRHQLLHDDNLGTLYDLLIDESPLIRHAVGELVYEHLIVQKRSSSQKGQDKEMEESEEQLKRLLLILTEFSTDPVLCDYVIDALWGEMKAMQDWKCITSMLLDDNPKVDLKDVDATNLCRILCGSVKKAVGEKLVPAVEPRKTNMTKTQKENFESNRKAMTSAMIKSHSKLLRKYLADKSKVAHIIEIVLYLKLDLYALKQQEQNLILTLQLIKDAFFKHGDEHTLKICISTLVFCANELEADLQSAAQRIFKETADELVMKLHSAIKLSGNAEDDYSLAVNFRRLHQLQLIASVPNESLFNDMNSLLDEFHNLDDEIIQLVLVNIFLHVMWCLKAIDSDDPNEAAVEVLRSKRDNLLKHLDGFTENVLEDQSRLALCFTICTICSDLWSLFSAQKLSSTKIESLGISPSMAMLQKFWQLCELALSAPDDEQEDVTKEQLKYLNQKDIIISSAAKLVAHDMVPKEFLGPEVISQYVVHGKAVDETLKQLILVLKKNMNSQELCNMYLEAMKKAYNRHLQDDSITDDLSKCDSFLTCKELAGRLSATFSGFARNIHQMSILQLVKGGIDFAFTDIPNKVSFLECCIMQFALRMPASDMREIIEDMEGRTKDLDIDENPARWRPYFVLLDSLKDKVARNEAPGSRPPTRSARTRNVRGKKLFDGQDEDNDDEDDQSDSDGDGDQEEDDDTPLFQVRQSVKSSRIRLDKVETIGSKQKGESSREVNRERSENVQGTCSQEHFDRSQPFGSATATEEQLPQ